MGINVYEGNFKADGLKFGIVCGRFNEFFTGKLLEGAIDAIKRHGGAEENIDAVWVPGCYELPFAAKQLLDSGKYDAVIALGVVIQGATPHAGYINSQVSKALGELAMCANTPVSYGIITADNIEQAIERSGTKAGNKGFDAGVSAIEMANLTKAIKPQG